MTDIKLHQLTKSFGTHVVLDALCATFPAQACSAIMAPSGRGKTTLLRLLIGLEKPDSGSISGIDCTRIAVVFQEDRLCEHLSAYTNLHFVTNQTKEVIHNALTAVGLAACIDQPVQELSGGMKRRIALLRALLSDYDVLFLDEPFKGLDADTKEQVIRYMLPLIQNKTVLLITHSKEEAEQLQAVQLLAL